MGKNIEYLTSEVKMSKLIGYLPDLQVQVSRFYCGEEKGTCYGLSTDWRGSLIILSIADIKRLYDMINEDKGWEKT